MLLGLSAFEVLDQGLIILEVRPVEGFELRHPNGELGPELLVLEIVAKDGVAGVLH